MPKTKSPRREREISTALLKWWRRNRRNFPWRSEKDPYKKLIAEIMLQRTRAEQVLGVYPKFIAKYPNPEALASASVPEIANFFSALGLVWRAKRVKELALRLVQMGGVPSSRDALLSLPGVGEYVADAILATAFEKDTVAVDSNVCRLVCRLFDLKLTAGEPRRDPRIKRILRSMMPANKAKEFNWALVDFGALVCRHRPKCQACPLSSKCKHWEHVQLSRKAPQTRR